MSDPRLTPDPALVTEHRAAQVVVPVTDLCRSPDGPRDRQMLFGAGLTSFGRAADGWVYVQAHSDNYVGFLRAGAIAAPLVSTHYVSAPATHIYESASLKSRDVLALSHLSRLPVLSVSGDFLQTAQGFVPRQHLCPVEMPQIDPAQVAALYLGTDYLWGGNSRWGIDCSGLVQAALSACGIPCPGDSDMQMALGTAASDGYRRNDLLFWKGHVALVYDAHSVIHANAHTMAVNFEPIDTAIKRILDKGDGPVTAHRRLHFIPS